MLPPWLWLYFLGVLAPSVPQAVESFQDNADGMAALVGLLAANVQRAGTAVLTATGILEFLPALLLLAGIAGVLFPVRADDGPNIAHRLLPSDEPVIGEMAASSRAATPPPPSSGSANATTGWPAHPVGLREARIAVYPPLVRLWSRGQAGGPGRTAPRGRPSEAGDHLIVGLASPFVWSVKSWGIALAVLALVPSTIYSSRAERGPRRCSAPSCTPWSRSRSA